MLRDFVYIDDVVSAILAGHFTLRRRERAAWTSARESEHDPSWPSSWPSTMAPPRPMSAPSIATATYGMPLAT